MWIIAIVVILLIWHNLMSKAVPGPNPPKMVYPSPCSGSTAGDTFTSGGTIVPGVHEPCSHVIRIQSPLRCDVNPIPIHILYPVNPPPIQIQTPVALRCGARQMPIHCCHITVGKFTCSGYGSRLAAGKARMLNNAERSSPANGGLCGGTTCFI